MMPHALLAGILVAAVVLQAALPSRRLLIVAGAAGISCLAATLLGVSTTGRLLAAVPWDVIVILVGLGLMSELVVASRLFGVLAALSTEKSGGDPRRVLPLFAVFMFLVSGLVNNLTALVFVLPILLILMKLLGATRRYAAWTLGVLLVACNLGGAATPIGDFPAILLLGRGTMGFGEYLVRAAPATLAGLVVLLALVLFVVRPERGTPRDRASARLSVAVMRALYRNVELDRSLLLRTGTALGAMLLAWTLLPRSLGVTPELVCWLGVGAALASSPKLGEKILRTRVDVEAALFLLSLFVMVAAVRQTGLFSTVARSLGELPLSPAAQLVVFLVASGLLTGIFSAGPSMAALLEVAESLAGRLPPNAVYVGLALSVCAGSSLFLTAATSGPMAQTLTERAGLRDEEGRPIRFGFVEFLPVGLLAYAVIQAVAVAYALLALLAAR